jgi:hypothetical protein
MMFYGDGEPCLFDWQMCQKGKGIFDVAFFLVLSTPTELLAANEHALLQAYHKALVSSPRAVAYDFDALVEDYKFAVAATWAIIVYVAGLLATKGPDWVDPIKIAAGRTVAAMNRLQVTPMVEALMDGGAIPRVAYPPGSGGAGGYGATGSTAVVAAGAEVDSM